MESLYRKYRPQTFADVVGQQHVVGTLEHAVLQGRTSHAYLFCGPRGTGKTTMARLLAKALLCEQGPGHLPDGTCHQCELIAAGDHPDVYELDAASRTGVDSVREEIINSVSYAPTQGRYKVYIIDEVHMLTTAAFNALLKTLEEPPSHVVFVLCTTDPQKIPATILSRVQRFDFRPIGNDDILAHLVRVCEQEGFTYEEAALELVTAHARGGMRDALSTLEQLSVFGGGVIGLEAAQDMLGAVSGMALEQVVAAMAARDVAGLFAQVGDLVNAGRDLLQFTRELAAHMRDVYVVAVAGANPAVLPAGANAQQLQAEAASFGTPDRLARILTLLGDVSREMSTAPNQRLVLEIAFTRIARPQSDLTLESVAERLAELERRLASGEFAASPATRVAAPAPVQAPVEKPAPAQSQTPAPVPGPAAYPTSQPAAGSAQAAEQPAASHPASQPAAEPAQAAAQPARTPAQAPAQQPAPSPTPVPPAQPASAPTTPQPAPVAAVPQEAAAQPAGQQGGLDAGALQRSWRKVVSELVARIPARGTLLSNAVATSDDGNVLVVSLPKGSSFALKMLERPDVRSIVEGVVREVFGPRTLSFREGTGTDLQVPPRRPKQAQAPAQEVQSVPAPAQVSAPAQAPQSTQAAAPAPAPQQVQPAAVPQAAPGYPMPWDAPSAQQAPAPEPSYDQEPFYEPVPYEELGGYMPAEAMYDESAAQEASALQSFSAPDQATAPTSAQTLQSAPQPFSAPAPRFAPAAPQQPVAQPEPELAPAQAASRAATPAAPAPQPAPAPQVAPASAPALTPEPAAQPAPDSAPREVPTDLPPELSNILENAFEVFGSGVRVSRNS